MGDEEQGYKVPRAIDILGAGGSTPAPYANPDVNILLGLKSSDARVALGDYSNLYDTQDFGPDLGKRMVPVAPYPVPKPVLYSDEQRAMLMDVERASSRRAAAQAAAAGEASAIARRRVLSQIAPTLVGTLFGGPDRSQRVAQAVDTLSEARVRQSLARETAASEAEIAEAAAAVRGIEVDKLNEEALRAAEAQRIENYGKMAAEFNAIMSDLTNQRTDLTQAQAAKAAAQRDTESLRLRLEEMRGQGNAAAYSGYAELEQVSASRAAVVLAAREAYMRDPDSEEGQAARRTLITMFRSEDPAQGILANVDEFNMVPWDDTAAQEYIQNQQRMAREAGMARVKILEDNPHLSAIDFSARISGGEPNPAAIMSREMEGGAEVDANGMPVTEATRRATAAAADRATVNEWARQAREGNEEAYGRTIETLANTMDTIQAQMRQRGLSEIPLDVRVKVLDWMEGLFKQDPVLRQRYHRYVAERASTTSAAQSRAIDDGVREGSR